MWKLNNQWIKAEMQQEIKDYLEANENENTAFQKVGEAAKAQVLHERFCSSLVNAGQPRSRTSGPAGPRRTGQVEHLSQVCYDRCLTYRKLFYVLRPLLPA